MYHLHCSLAIKPMSHLHFSFVFNDITPSLFICFLPHIIPSLLVCFHPLSHLHSRLFSTTSRLCSFVFHPMYHISSRLRLIDDPFLLCTHLVARRPLACLYSLTIGWNLVGNSTKYPSPLPFINGRLAAWRGSKRDKDDVIPKKMITTKWLALVVEILGVTF